jgi:hypothetical protein
MNKNCNEIIKVENFNVSGLFQWRVCANFHATGFCSGKIGLTRMFECWRDLDRSDAEERRLKRGWVTEKKQG